MNPPTVRLRLLDTGYCTASASHVLRGAPNQQITCHALVALIEHPICGPVLWDTGYAPRIFEALHPWPFLLYQYATPLHLDPDLAAVSQIHALGIDPAAITYVIVSHFHLDHIAGLADFPQAAIIAAADAIEHVIGVDGFAALRRGFVPALMPADFTRRVQPIYRFDGPEVAPFGRSHDLFGDGSLVLVQLPGHARGQIGLLAHTASGPVLLAADGAWQSRSIREQRGPGAPGYLIADNPRELDATLAKLHQFAQAHPEVTILPTHCPESYALVGRTM
ncbi:MAG: MBL fold metallo-hydrolase [Oscillochloris sp.]|nr:MBL fold metallo-hydrolase [Oscillochloris sp.]